VLFILQINIYCIYCTNSISFQRFLITLKRKTTQKTSIRSNNVFKIENNMIDVFDFESYSLPTKDMEVSNYCFKAPLSVKRRTECKDVVFDFYIMIAACSLCK